MVGVPERNGDSQPATPSARVPLSVFSQSSSLMSDRAAQAMEKALRNLANPHREVNATNNKDEDGYKDLLEHPETDRRSFVKRDAADLFNSSASANDKDGKLTTREMSLPRAFYSRVDVQDSAHSASELSGSEDAEITHRRNLSTTVPGPLLLDRSVFSDSETDRDSAIFLGTAPEDLDLVENAILRIIREDARAFSKQRDEDATKPKELSECLEKSEEFRSTAGSVDFQLLSRLLDQVQALREQKHQHKQVGRIARSSTRSARSMWDISKSGKSKRLKNDDMKKAIEAATQAAKSAAEAAKIAAALVTQNSDAVNKLLQIMHPSSKMSDSEPEEKDTRVDSESEDIEELSDSDETKDIAKKIVSQNRYTHVVLGIMLVSSFVWRYIIVKVAKNVKSKVTDPWGYIGGMLPDRFRGPDKEAEKSEESSSGPSMPQKALHFLHGDREKEKEDSTSDDKDSQTLTLGNILQIKPNNTQ